MKSLAFALFCVFTACLAETPEESGAICLAELEIDLKDYSREDPKCLLLCVFRRTGVVTGECNISVERLKEVIPRIPKEAALRLPECVQEHNEPDCCTRVLALNKCAMDIINNKR